MTTKEQREILEAYERGEEIEYGLPNYEWCTLLSKEEYIKEFGYEYQFNFYFYEYRIKKKPWRAKEGETYYYINTGLIVTWRVDNYEITDEDCFNAGNYFRTKELAEKARELIKECLTKFHEND